MTQDSGEPAAVEACQYWDHRSCAGTAACPPRCPRFVDAFGTPMIVRLADDGEPTESSVDERAALSTDETRRFVATESGDVVGHATLEAAGDGDLLLSIGVEPASRAGGLPAELVRQAVAHAAANEWGERVVAPLDHGDATARRRYARLGFVPTVTDRTHESDGTDGTSAMTLDLDAPTASQVQLAPGLGSDEGAPSPSGFENPTGSGDIEVSDPLDRLFEPDRVAVVGATDRPGAIGSLVTENLVKSFQGEVVPVTPTSPQVHGIETYSDVREIPGQIDLAVVVLPPSATLDALEAIGNAGVPVAVVVSAGFGETGGDGIRRERELVRIAATYDITLVGPNSLGVLSTGRGLNASFAPTLPSAGSISFMSQSGALITAVVDWAADRGIGFEHVVSLGNEADVDEVDLLAYWDADPDTDVILAYLEGIDDGRTFLSAASAATTPVVVLKSGRTEAGSQAAASHTGSMAGGTAAFDAACERAGVVQVESIDALLDAARALSALSSPPTEEVGIVTNAGGPGVLAADAVGDAGMELASFGSETTTSLRQRLPEMASATNPLDVLGDADVERFRDALDAVLSDDRVGAGMVLTTPHPLIEPTDLATAIGAAADAHDKPVVTCLMGADDDPEATAALDERGIPNYFDPARAARGLAAVVEAARGHDQGSDESAFDVDRDRAESILARARRDGRITLGVEAMDLLDAYGVPTPAGELVESAAAAETVANRLGERVVMKVASPDIPHKSDVGGVEVDVRPADAAEVYRSSLAAVSDAAPDARILGVYVQEQIDLDDGVETIAGMHRDPQFGPVTLFGLGGVLVEALEDVSFGIAPLSADAAAAMVADTRAGEILTGVRGRPAADREAVHETLQRLAQLAVDFPALDEFDVNPLVATPDGVVALDLQVELRTD